MNQVTSPETADQQTVNKQGSQQLTEKRGLLVPVLFVLLAILAFTLGFFAYQNYQLKNLGVQKEQRKVLEIAQEKEVIEWETAMFGSFTYEYPLGWHVGELWPEDYNDPIVIVIDPNPISTAPHGGPRATFEMTVNDTSSAGEFIKEEMENFTNFFEDIDKETIEDYPLTPIYHLKGKFPEGMFGNEPSESYIVAIPSTTILDSQRVIVVDYALARNPEYSDLLRKIVLSFKLIQ